MTKNDEVIFVSGIAGTLIANQKFNESINAEKWWQKMHSEWLQKGLKITTICLHPSPILNKNQFMDYKQAISLLHNITLDPISGKEKEEEEEEEEDARTTKCCLRENYTDSDLENVRRC